MQRILLIFLFLPVAGAFLRAQQLSGLINDYAAILSLDECAGELTLSDTTGFAPGTAVLLLQMQGALISDADAPSFGDLQELRGAGRYERNRIAARNGNTVTLTDALANAYDPAGKLQLVSLPEYEDATVTAPLTPAPWNGATGGVLALEVTGTLTLQADLDATGTGFRGGLSQIEDDNNCSFLANQNNWYYPLDDWRGVPKGEGAAGFTPGREAGRGAQLNGGGGGNDHNSGGGGGAQISGGGQGGNNDEPSTFGCDGDFPGRGGKALPQEPGRLFLGGGGGAGHENNDVGSDGGNGGGILLLLAGTIEGNGFTLRSNGADADVATGDGAGGGGGGGAIVLDAQTVNGLTIEARGGNGGNIDNGNDNRCYGPGGGGSGGRLLINLPLPADLSGGQPGQSLNSGAGGCGGTNGAAPGEGGQTEAFEGIPASGQENAPPAIAGQPLNATACDGDTLLLPVTTSGNVDGYQWQVDTGSGFADLMEGVPYSGTQSPTLSVAPVSDQLAGYQFRLEVANACGDTLLSDPIEVDFQELPTATFSTQLFGLAVQFANQSTNADSYVWDFGGGNTSTSPNPTYGFPASGDYPVTLIASNDCGSDTITTIVTISNQPVADFTTSTPTTGCAPFTVFFVNNSQNAVSYEWQLPGASPSISTDPDPTATYNTPGGWDVILIAFNGAEYDTLMIMNYITVTSIPTPNFTFTVNGSTVNFTDASAGADSYLWDFGDGNTSTEADPSHMYQTSGVYPVTLTVTNDCGPVTLTQEVTIDLDPAATFTASITDGCAPMTVTFNGANSLNAETWQWILPGATPAGGNQPQVTVTYNTPGQYDATLIVGNASGTDTLLLPAYITVADGPTAGFSANVNNLTVDFVDLSLNADSYAWTFGEGGASNAPAPAHTYLAPGDYTVTLTVTNDCGTDTFSLTITVGATPQAGFTFSPQSGCAPLTVQFTNQSTGPVETYAWSFPGGMPATSTEPDPVVTYATPGLYDVELIVTAPTGISTRLSQNVIEVFALPTPDFSFELTGETTVTFTNLSTDATDYFWDFGDGNTSLEAEPAHTYAAPGYYQVTLNALTPFCGRATSQYVLIETTATGGSLWEEAPRVYPNPAGHELWIEWLDAPGPARMILYNATGQVVRHQETIFSGDRYRLNLSGLAGGMYVLEVRVGGKRWVMRVVKHG